jgi:hypothetical protein
MNMTTCQNYDPDIQGQCDCINCGHPWEAHKLEPMKQLNAEVSETVKGIRAAAVEFANDTGPLEQANKGVTCSQHEVGRRLVRAIRKHGLKIIQS